MPRTLNFLLVCVFLPVFLVTAELSPRQADHRHVLSHRRKSYNEQFSLFSVCDAEVQQMCSTEKEAPLKCLLQHLFETKQSTRISEGKQAHPSVSNSRTITFSKECSKWLWAREECVSYVRRAGVCLSSETARDCLRRVPPRQLPSECRNTGYYRGVLLYGEMKKRQKMLMRTSKGSDGAEYL